MNIYIRFFHEQKGIETIETRLKKTSHRLFNNLVYDVGQERIKKKLSFHIETISNDPRSLSCPVTIIRNESLV